MCIYVYKYVCVYVYIYVCICIIIYMCIIYNMCVCSNIVESEEFLVDQWLVLEYVKSSTSDSVMGQCFCESIFINLNETIIEKRSKRSGELID